MVTGMAALAGGCSKAYYYRHTAAETGHGRENGYDGCQYC